MSLYGPSLKDILGRRQGDKLSNRIGYLDELESDIMKNYADIRYFEPPFGPVGVTGATETTAGSGVDGAHGQAQSGHSQPMGAEPDEMSEEGYATDEETESDPDPMDEMVLDDSDEMD